MEKNQLFITQSPSILNYMAHINIIERRLCFCNSRFAEFKRERGGGKKREKEKDETEMNGDVRRRAARRSASTIRE